MHTFQVMFSTLCLFNFGLIQLVTSSDLVFTSTPATIRPLVTDDLSLRCSLKDGASSVVIGKREIELGAQSATEPADVSTLQTIMITKSGQDIATVSAQFAARIFDNATGVTVTGQVPGSGDERGYLQVNWRYPGSTQAGKYECVISGITQRGHLQTFTQSLDISETEVSLNDVVKYIHQLQITNDIQSKTIASMKANMTSVNNQNLSGIHTDIAGIKAKITVLDRTIANLTSKLDTHVAFTAVLTSATSFSSGKPIVFNIVRTNIGGGFNASSGIFTCPIAGYYYFDVHIMGQSDKWAVVKLLHNGNVVSAAYADDNVDYQSGSTSANILLKQGDTVTVESIIATSYIYSDSDRYCSFSGHLFSLT